MLLYHQPLCSLTSDKERESSQRIYCICLFIGSVCCPSAALVFLISYISAAGRYITVFLPKLFFTIFSFFYRNTLYFRNKTKCYIAIVFVWCCSAPLIVLESFGKALGNLKSKSGTSGFTWKKWSLLQREIPSHALEQKSNPTKPRSALVKG